MLQLLLSQSPDIQKILAFEGAFEKLFNIVTQEGGVDGGVSVRDALACVDTLLRFNPSNQVAPLIHMPRREHRPQYISRVTSVKRRFHQSCRPYCYSRLHYRHTNLRRRTLFCSSNLRHGGQYYASRQIQHELT